MQHPMGVLLSMTTISGFHWGQITYCCRSCTSDKLVFVNFFFRIVFPPACCVDNFANDINQTAFEVAHMNQRGLNVARLGQRSAKSHGWTNVWISIRLGIKNAGYLFICGCCAKYLVSNASVPSASFRYLLLRYNNDRVQSSSAKVIENCSRVSIKFHTFHMWNSLPK